MKYNNYSFTRESSGYLDEGLRIYMLSIYKNMSMALGISGLVAYIIGSNTQIAMMLFSTPLAYAVMFAPLIYIFFFSRNLMSMDKQRVLTTFLRKCNIRENSIPHKPCRALDLQFNQKTFP